MFKLSSKYISRLAIFYQKIVFLLILILVLCFIKLFISASTISLSHQKFQRFAMDFSSISSIFGIFAISFSCLLQPSRPVYLNASFHRRGKLPGVYINYFILLIFVFCHWASARCYLINSPAVQDLKSLHLSFRNRELIFEFINMRIDG